MHRFGLVFLGLALVLPLGEARADDTPVPISRDTIEQLRRQAVDQFDLKRYEDAEKSFYDVIRADPEAASAAFATDYLKQIVVENGTVKSAISDYRSLKAKGEIKEIPELNPIQRDTLDSLREPLQLAKSLFSFLNLGGILAARTSLLSVVMDGLGLNEETAYYFKKAGEVAEKVQKEAYVQARSFVLTRPLTYRFPSWMSQTGLPAYESGQIEIVPFEREQSELSRVRLKNELNRGGVRLAFGWLGGYDSNIARAQDGPSGGLRTVHARVGVQSRPGDPWVLGTDYRLLIRGHSRGELDVYNASTHIFSGWTSWWDRNRHEVRMRVDGGYSTAQPPGSGLFTSSVGPQLGWLFRFNPRTQLELAYGLHWQRDAKDPGSGPYRRRGVEHSVRFQLSYPGQANRVQPFTAFVFERMFARGSEFSSIRYAAEAGAVTLLGSRSAFKLTTGMEFKVFPAAIVSRRNRVQRIQTDLLLPVVADTLSVFAAGEYRKEFSDVAIENWSGFWVSGGFAISLGT